ARNPVRGKRRAMAPGGGFERLDEDALLAVLVRMSFTWYGALRTTCRRLRQALSPRGIWAARRAAGVEESTFVVMLRPEGNGTGYDSAFFVPRVGGGWVQLRSPALTLPESGAARAIDGTLHLRLESTQQVVGKEKPSVTWLTWLCGEWLAGARRGGQKSSYGADVADVRSQSDR
ncbi:MAG: hypothetical protein AAFV01_13950, partial [Bacteroidota bacterium]